MTKKKQQPSNNGDSIISSALPEIGSEAASRVSEQVISKLVDDLRDSSLYDEHGNRLVQIHTNGTKTPSLSQIAEKLDTKPPKESPQDKEELAALLKKQQKADIQKRLDEIQYTPEQLEAIKAIIATARNTVEESPVFTKETKDIMYKAIAVTACLILGTALAIGLCAAIGMSLPIVLAAGALFGAATGIAVANAMGNDKTKPASLAQAGKHPFFETSAKRTEPSFDLEPDNTSSKPDNTSSIKVN